MIHKSTFEELLNRNVCVSIDFQKLGRDISKFVKSLHPEIMNEIFQIYWKGKCHYQLRSRASLHPTLVLSVFNGTERVTFLGPQLWETISNESEQLQSLQKFKVAMKKWKSLSCPCIKLYLHGIGFL